MIHVKVACERVTRVMGKDSHAKSSEKWNGHTHMHILTYVLELLISPILIQIRKRVIQLNTVYA